MSFNQRFELLDLVRDEGVRSFRAVETTTGRPVLVHVFVNAGSPQSVALLAKVDRLPAEELRRIVDRGQHEGTPYLVTDRLPEYQGLREWLEARGSAATAEINPLNTAGAWKPLSVPPVPAAGAKNSLDDEFARLFEAVAPPPPTNLRPQASIRRDEKTEAIPVPRPAQPAPPVAGSTPGAFTQMFQPPPATPKPAPLPAQPVAPAQPSQPAAEPTPGSFTQLFQAPGSASKPASPPAPRVSPAQPSRPAAEPTPGSFTQMFQAPASASKPAPSPEPVPPPLISPPVAEAPAGAFTQMFQAPAPALKPAPSPAPPAPPPLTSPPVAEGPAGAFTQMFQAPAPAAKPAPSPAPPVPPALASPPVAEEPAGAFTQLFQAPASHSKPAPPASTGLQTPVVPHAPTPSPAAPGEFTQLFEVPIPSKSAPAPPPAAASPPGAFTQMFQSPLGGSKPIPPSTPPAGPASPSAGSAGTTPGEFTRMFQSPGSRPSGGSPPQGQAPPGEFTSLFESPGAAGPMPRSPAVRQPLTPRPGSSSGSREGEFTRVFGPRDVPTGPPNPPPSSGPISAGATQTFSTQQPPPAPVRLQEGPGDFTRAFAVPAPLPTLGQQATADPKPPPSALPEMPSRLPLILGLVAIGIFVVALIVFLVYKLR